MKQEKLRLQQKNKKKQLGKDQENPDFCASVTFGSFPYNPVVNPGRSGNCPVASEISSPEALESLW